MTVWVTRGSIVIKIDQDLLYVFNGNTLYVRPFAKACFQLAVRAQCRLRPLGGVPQKNDVAILSSDRGFLFVFNPIFLSMISMGRNGGLPVSAARDVPERKCQCHSIS